MKNKALRLVLLILFEWTLATAGAIIILGFLFGANIESWLDFLEFAIIGGVYLLWHNYDEIKEFLWPEEK